MPFEKLSEKVFRRYISGQNEMLVYFLLKKGAIIQKHHHISEQITYIVKGSVKVLSRGKTWIVRAGDVLVIPPNVCHQFEALEDTVDIDIFSPIRQDWLDGRGTYFK
jgi:quercetin dioxygenase-like cupin family protein